MLDRLDALERATIDAGLRRTAQRTEILRCLANLPKHFGTEEVMQALTGAARGRRVSRATLYRFLAALERLGILRRVLLSEGHSHFEFALLGRKHCHLVCPHCGRVAEIFSAALARGVGRACKEHGFEAGHCELEIRALCNSCRGSALSRSNDFSKGGE